MSSKKSTKNDERLVKHIKPREQNIPRNALNSTKQEILKTR